MDVFHSRRSHGPASNLPDWRPDLDVNQGARYQSTGCPDPGYEDEHENDVPNARRLEGLLRKLGLVHVPDEPNDMSIYEASVAGRAPTLRESLEEFAFDEDWVKETALRQVLWKGASFYPAFGLGREYRLDRLPTGWGEKRLPSHFAPLINSLAQAGFCELVGQDVFVWKDAIKPHGIAVLSGFWGDGPHPREQRRWELLYIWHKMPKHLKSKYLVKKGPLSAFELTMDLGAFYNRHTRRWQDKPHPDRTRIFVNQDLSAELDALDREDGGLPGRKH